MKYLFKLSIILCLIFCQGNCFAQERTVVRYVQNNDAKSEKPLEISPILPKNQRVSSKAGNIHLVYEDGVFPDSMLISMQAAAEIWEAKICNKQPIYISVSFEDLYDDDLSLLCDVIYYESEDGGCPSALYSQLRGKSDTSEYDPDAVMIFNSTVEWNCSHDDKSWNNGVNVFSSMLRAIALSLGFGTSATVYEDDEIVFPLRFSTSRFDNLICSSNGEWLKDFRSGSAELRSFMTPAADTYKIYAYKDEIPYKLYAPASYELGRSLVYLDNPNSLMHYGFGQGDKSFQIDNVTFELLNAIGWNLAYSSNDLEIVSDQIGEDGIASAYESYEFSISNMPSGNLVDPQWSFCLYDKNGKAVEIKTGNSSKFEITPVNNPDNYQITSNGDLKGTVNFKCMVNGVEYVAKPYRLSLELKPVINSISDVQIIDGQYSKTLLCNISYTGADYVSAAVEEEYSTTVRTFHYNEPFLAHICIENITRYYMAWVDIKVANKYGLVMETIEIDTEYNKSTDNDSNRISQSVDNVNEVQVFSMQGKLLGTYESIERAKALLASGMYVVKTVDEQNQEHVTKMIL